MIIILLIIIALAVAAMIFLRKKAAQSMVGEVSYTSAQVQRTNITQSISGSGSLAAANSYTVSGLYSGEIIPATLFYPLCTVNRKSIDMMKSENN